MKTKQRQGEHFTTVLGPPGDAGGESPGTSGTAAPDSLADFVTRDSVVRRIWGDGDMVLLVFAGSAAEFALNRAVDWLFFTGELPRNPMGRLFSTAGYSQYIVFADVATATRTFERI